MLPLIKEMYIRINVVIRDKALKVYIFLFICVSWWTLPYIVNLVFDSCSVIALTLSWQTRLDGSR